MTHARKIGLAAALVIAACAEPPVTPIPQMSAVNSASSVRAGNSYVIIGAGEALPADLTAAVEAAGGSITAAYPQIGVAVATSENPSFGSAIGGMKGVESVTPDMELSWVQTPEGIEVSESVDAEAVNSANDPFYRLQWAPAAISAPEAWALGYDGAGVRVGILDGAIHNTHVDLSANLDVARSASMVPGFAYNQDVGTFWHGTHVAGIVAAADNNAGTVGIAPRATLVGVKVLHNGSGAFSWIASGIMYAATPIAEGGAGVNIINMSLGATIPNEKDPAEKAGVRELKKFVDRATKYAHQRGVTIIASAGNSGINMDAEKFVWKTPAMNQYVISVSATGPHGWALGATDFDRPTYYTDHGKALVDVAAPGGTPGLAAVDGIIQNCAFQGQNVGCHIYDYVLSSSRGTTANGSWSWAYGTSMAAPAASGVAALIIQKNGGSMHPDAVRTALQRSSIDLGKPGKDLFYGHGWVNALRAVQ